MSSKPKPIDENDVIIHTVFQYRDGQVECVLSHQGKGFLFLVKLPEDKAFEIVDRFKDREDGLSYFFDFVESSMLTKEALN